MNKTRIRTIHGRDLDMKTRIYAGFEKIRTKIIDGVKNPTSRAVKNSKKAFAATIADGGNGDYK